MKNYPLAGAVILLVILFIMAGTVPGGDEGRTSPFSSYSRSPTGMLAAFLLVKSRGFRVGRVEGHFELPGSGVLIIVEPLLDFGKGEVEEVVRFVRGGGFLILVTRFGNRLTDALGMDTVKMTQRVEEVAPLLPHRFAEWVERVEMDATEEIVPAEGSIPLFGGEGRLIMAARRIGEGWVIFGSSPFPFTNSLLREEGNLALFLNLVNAGIREGEVVLFDEYHAGIKGKKGLTGYLQRVRPVESSLFLVLLLLTLLWYNLFPAERGRGAPSGETGLKRGEEMTLYELLQGTDNLKAATDIIILERVRQEFPGMASRSLHEQGGKGKGADTEGLPPRIREALNAWQGQGGRKGLSLEEAVNLLNHLENLIEEAKERRRSWKR